MPTIENHKIRVTVTPEIWNSYTERARQLAATQAISRGRHAPDATTIQRGLVLSDAHRWQQHREYRRALVKNGPRPHGANYIAVMAYDVLRGYTDPYNTGLLIDLADEARLEHEELLAYYSDTFPDGWQIEHRVDDMYNDDLADLMGWGVDTTGAGASTV